MAAVMMTVEGTTRELDWQRMLISEATECQRLTGYTYSEWKQALAREDALAIAYGWWLACKRAGDAMPSRFSELDFDMGTLRWEPVTQDEVDAAAGVQDGDSDFPTSPDQAEEESQT